VDDGGKRSTAFRVGGLLFSTTPGTLAPAGHSLYVILDLVGLPFSPTLLFIIFSNHLPLPIHFPYLWNLPRSNQAILDSDCALLTMVTFGDGPDVARKPTSPPCNRLGLHSRRTVGDSGGPSRPTLGMMLPTELSRFLSNGRPP
jgi:hypothetical protein